MIKPAVMLAFSISSFPVFAERENFDAVPPGGLPDGWQCGVTGRGSPTWGVVTDLVAPSPPYVLSQSGSGTFPWCVVASVAIANGYVEAKVRPASGIKDQAGGLVWRWKRPDTYYVARINALENTVALYHVRNGRRSLIRRAWAPVPRDIWQTLRVDFSGTRIAVSWNGRVYIEARDRHITGAGAVGVWTRRDSNTAFDDFAYGSSPALPPPRP